ncbi:hypothetical protein [Galbibacter sp.]|uniref:hypothetical protein n=1 Tax=Galbibacter sp. TaxID=2918471 RepID=UPI002BC1318A|nr:hypothetical protein [Galbibacter sp.]HLV62592.1 hypothetical protein [Galbibacter sp.]
MIEYTRQRWLENARVASGRMVVPYAVMDHNERLTISSAERLKLLKELHTSALKSQKEYDQKKAEILKSL